MTRPIYEPTPARTDARLGFTSNQLLRRPAEPSGGDVSYPAAAFISSEALFTSEALPAFLNITDDSMNWTAQTANTGTTDYMTYSADDVPQIIDVGMYRAVAAISIQGADLTAVIGSFNLPLAGPIASSILPFPSLGIENQALQQKQWLPPPNVFPNPFRFDCYMDLWFVVMNTPSGPIFPTLDLQIYDTGTVDVEIIVSFWRMGMGLYYVGNNITGTLDPPYTP